MEELSRRSLIAGACAIIALGSVSLPVAANAAVKKIANGRVSVRVRAIPELSQVGGAVSIGKVKGKPVGLARTGPSLFQLRLRLLLERVLGLHAPLPIPGH